MEADTSKLMYEVIASLVVALVTAVLLFKVFFDGWTDYWQCCRRPSLLDSLLPDQADVSDRARGFFYNVLWLGAGGLAFYCFRKFFG